MNLSFYIAGRYLFAKKSHNVINIISAISAVGMGIGTAALIIILSVYNGFDSLVRSSLSNVEPDILVSPARGKVFVPDNEAFDWLYDQAVVKNMCSILEENVYVSYEGKNGVAKARGVDAVYEEESPLASGIVDGRFALHKGSVPLCVIGAGFAYKMGISPRFLASVDIYFPSRTSRLSTVNPTASLENISVYPAGLFSVNSEEDNNLIILPLEKMRELLDYTDEVSGIEIRLMENTSPGDLRKLIAELQKRLGEDYVVKDRFRQNEAMYKMMQYEKSAIYLILIFVIIIIAFNIFGSLSMLIIEKKDDIATLRSMGATDRLVRRIFVTEGWLISLSGLVGGLLCGILAVVLQSRFGFVRMPGSFMGAAYPVILNLRDVLFTAVSVALIGYMIALLGQSRVKGE